MQNTDKDLGDENELLPNNLNKSTFSCATVDLSTSRGNTSQGAGDEEEVAGPSVDILSKKNKGQNVNAFL